MNNKNVGIVTNYGAIFDVTGSSLSNIAIAVENGDINLNNGRLTRFSLSFKSLTANYTISDNDEYTVFLGNGTSKIDVIAPPNPQKGRIIIIKNQMSKDMGFNMSNGHKIQWMGSLYDWDIVKGTSGGSTGCSVFMFTGFYWQKILEGKGDYQQGNQ